MFNTGSSQEVWLVSREYAFVVLFPRLKKLNVLFSVHYAQIYVLNRLYTVYFCIYFPLNTIRYLFHFVTIFLFNLLLSKEPLS